MKKWKLPVEYAMYGTVEVEAETIEDAIKYFNENSDAIELPYGSEYIDGSFQLNGDSDFIKFVNR